ncbi:MAG: DUF3772 domain-containing protein [Sedimentitalea sp.]
MTCVLRRYVLASLVALFAFSIASFAQDSDTPSEIYQSWLQVASRAEAAVDAQRASNVTFERLRGEVANYRETFTRLRDLNTSRIRTLQSQLSALGPAPELGEEQAEIAALRATLNGQLDELRAPRIVAEEAYNRANGLVGEIDRIIRDRQTNELMSRGMSPLNPGIWVSSYREVGRFFTAVRRETVSAMTAETSRVELRRNLPLLVVLSAVGLLLVIRGTRWAERLGEYLRGFGGRGSGVWSFIVSLARIFVPLAGVVAITQAISLSGMLGARSDTFVRSLPAWGALLLQFNWVCNRLFVTPTEQREAMTPKRLRSVRFYVALLAMMLILVSAISILEQVENLTETTRAVLGFVPVVLTGLGLIRLQHVALRPAPLPPETGEDTGPRRVGLVGLIPLLRRIMALIGVTGPVLAAVGYGNAAEALVYPTVLTLALIAAVVILQRFLSDVFALIGKTPENGGDSLFGVLAGFVLVLAALPVAALFWGARVADLTEVWAKFLAGFQMGDTRISPLDFLTFAVLFAAGYVLTRLLQNGLRNSLLPKTRIDPGGQNAIVSGTGYIGIFLAAVIAITGAGLDLSSLAIVAGALSVGIGFGLQNIVSNFVSGIILLVERPVSKGDWSEVGGQMGYVCDISVRSTRIETFDRTDVIVPNSDLISNSVTNYTRGNTVGRVIVPVGVAYGTDTRRVEQILREIANDHPMVLVTPPASVVFQGFGADSLDFEIRAILRDVNWALGVKSDMNHAIAKRFVEEGIEIPYAQRDIWIRNPEALRAENPVPEPE